MKWRFTDNELKKGVKLETGHLHIITVIRYKLHVKLDIDPHKKSSVDDTFTLFGGESITSKEYSQTKTIKDDLVKDDDAVDLIFTNLRPNLRYWLEIDPGKEGQTYFALEDIPWNELKEIMRQ